MRIQHNIAALNSHRQLTSNNSAVSKNLEKLSSGYKINRAGDDAAGLAISEKMRAQITGLDTASRNAQDGISLVQTAEGALTEVHSMLNRMAELADQSANGTYQDAVDRENIQKELESLSSEIDRISEGTNFNGIKLLDGSMSSAKDSASIANFGGYKIDGLNENVSKIEFVTTAGAADAAADVTKVELKDGVLTITGTTKDGTGTELSNVALEAALTTAGQEGAKVSGTGTFTTQAATNTTKTPASSGRFAASTQGAGFKINIAKGAYSKTTGLQIAADALANGVGATRTGTALELILETGKSYTASEINKMLKENGAGEITVSFEGKKLAADIVTGLDLDTQAKGTITAGTGTAGGGLSLQIGESSDSYNQLSVSVKSMSASSLGIGGLDVSTQESAKGAIDLIKTAIDTVSSTRGDLGAIQNRLEHTINNLGVTSENMSAAESRIRDVDMAKEMMTYTKNNILTQASQAMLAQANQLPQGVLQLLQ